ncbi:MAG TPA: gamma-glutamyltransferase [Ignavibacteriaceae bacterium]|nr:gamma-glutamyltransferase [Ignavibacteriaceae bacterium]
MLTRTSVYSKINLLSFAFIFLASSTNLYPQSHQPLHSKNGMVVSASSYASKVGIDILKKGGNAIDAAVAVGFTLAVTFPSAGNIGGGGFMVIHLANGKNVSIDFREKAPLSATKNMYLDENGNYIEGSSLEGTTSAGVPGSVAGLIDALENYGALSLEEVIQPAIDLAKNGWIMSEYDAKLFNKYAGEFIKYPSSAKIFLNNRELFKKGDVFKQPELAWTLQQIKEKGADGFYQGKVAELLINQIKSMGGSLTKDDLEKYDVKEREPVTGTYRGYKIVSMPPPSSGGIALIEFLNILENYNISMNDWGSSKYIHHLAEAMKYVYADRTYDLGDDDFYPVPREGLISKQYARSIYDKIEKYEDKAVPANEIKRGDPNKFVESDQTTHYSVYDKFGNAVSTTTTINSTFGSKVVVEGAGFLLNNEMDDFSVKPGVPNQFGLLGSEANSIEPEKRMLSSMTPTIVLKDDKPYIVVGSPGGSKIITTVLQVILNCIDFKMNIQQAIDLPRIHDQWYPDELYYERFAFSDDTYNILEKMGYKFVNLTENDEFIGIAEGILIDNNKKTIYGASDPRGSGSVIGY